MASKYSIKLLIEAFVKGTKDILGLSKQVDQLGDKSQETSRDTDRLAESLGRVRTVSKKVARALKGLVAATAARFFIKTNADLESMAKGFELVTGSAEQAREEMDFVRTAAQRLGLSVGQASKAYLQLAAASKGTALEGAQTRRIFVAISAAMGKLGNSAADTEGALQAIQQMISKGTVSAEELRGQLGERLPGALQAAARAIGVTTSELGEMLKAGELTAEELLPKLSAELEKTFGSDEKITSFTASWQRFLNTLGFVAQEGERATGALGLLGRGLDKAGTFINFVTLALTSLAAEFVAAGKSIGAFFAYLSSDQSWDDFKKNVDAAFTEATSKIDAARDRIKDFDQNLKDATETTKDSAKASAESSAAIETMGDRAEKAAPKLDKLSTAATGVGKALKIISAENAKAAASYLTGIQNAQSMAEVNIVLKRSYEELGDNLEVMAVVSDAAATKMKDLADAEKTASDEAKKQAGEAVKLTQKLHDQAIAAARVTESTGKNYQAMLDLAGAYRRGEISLQEYYRLQFDLIQKNIDLRKSQDNVTGGVRETADAMRDLGDAGAEAGASISASMSRAAEDAQRAADAIRRAKNNVTAEDEAAGITYRTSGTPIPAGIGERQKEIALQYGQEAADAFMKAVIAAINAGISDVYRLLSIGNAAVFQGGRSTASEASTATAQTNWMAQQKEAANTWEQSQKRAADYQAAQFSEVLTSIPERFQLAIDGRTLYARLEEIKRLSS